MTNEEIISKYLQEAYTDERLAMLRAHCEDGKLAYVSCCCLVGVATAKHPLQGHLDVAELEKNRGVWGSHGTTYSHIENGFRVSGAYSHLATGFDDRDAERRAKLLPLILAEQERREALRTPAWDAETVEVMA